MKSILKNKWIKYKNKKIKILRKNDKLILTNNSSSYGYFVIPKIFKFNFPIIINFKGNLVNGTSCVLYVMNTHKNILGEATLNSETEIKNIQKTNALIAIKIMPYSKVELFDISYKEDTKDFILKELKSDILIISPNYPSSENKYLCGFVHSRLIAYKKAGIKFDLIVAHDYPSNCKYIFEGINVIKVPFYELRNILRVHKYDKILIHFFDYKYANVLDSCDISKSQLFLWVHGPETLYWDWPKFTTPYFKKEENLTDSQIKLFKENDKLISRYNLMPNVSWIFVSNWIKNRSEELTKIKFNNYFIIPNIIDANNFNYKEKSDEQRKKIFFLRRFDDCNKYAIDVNVRCILELSKRDCFNDMEFNIYGIGDVYEKLVQPLKKFPNVNLYPRFLSHEEISKIHKNNGIALFATRYDAQGVSMCEAAMSGLVIVTSNNEAVKEFLPNNANIFANTENYIEYADIIENLYNNPKMFLQYSKLCHETINNKCDFNSTVKKEIEIFKNKDVIKNKSKVIKPNKEVILSIIIPAYNVSLYLNHTINTILNQKNANKVEIIIVNDGSKDNTLNVINEIIEKYGNDVIKLINKENGGHGSTINEGIKKVTGKYTRIIDGDDWVNSKDLEKLIDILEKENSNIVITNYSEDRSDLNILVKREIYNFMIPSVKYNFDDLCNDNYGFQDWGPILATGNFKTEILKKSKYLLSEKSFYVDMEFDLFSIINATTITFYDLDIYRYFIGRVDQSISKNSYMKNYSQHENVIFRMIEITKNDETISEPKKEYAYKKLILPMIKTNYIILCDYIQSAKKFRKFDAKLKTYDYIYNSKFIASKYIRFERNTKGVLLKFNNPIKLIYTKFRNRGKYGK